MPLATSVLDSIDNLPTLPIVVIQVQKLISDPDCDISRIAEVISRDQAIATRVIRLVNSAFYGFDEHISSIQHAIVILGLNAVKNLVLGVSIIKTFEDNASTWSFDRRQFWMHTLTVALGAKLLASSLKRPDHEDYFLAGLLHDVGLLVLDQFMHGEFKRILTHARRYHTDFISAEQSVLGMTHGAIGAYLAARWKLPDFVVHSIAWHHAPSAVPEQAVFSRDKIAVVHVADFWAFKSVFGHFIEPFECQLDEQVLIDLHLTTNQLDSLLDRALQDVQNLTREWGL